MGRRKDTGKLLIIGGASQHCKVVETAKEMGLETYVVDFLPDAPAKNMADHSYMINVTQTEEIKNLCERESIDGVVSGWLDFCQMPYQKICDAGGYISYASAEQFMVLTRKQKFKEICELYGVGQPRRFDCESFLESTTKELPYPLFIKPSDSRGSKGSSICRTKDELRKAVEVAKRESFDQNYVAEQLIERAHVLLVVYFFVEGKPYLQQLSDAYFGDEAYGMQKINVVYKSPSKYYDKYLRIADEKMRNMLVSLGLKNGPVCFQCFLTNEDEVLFYDPGRRFPGGEYERGLKRATGVDFVRKMISFSLSGRISQEGISDDLARLHGKHIIRLQLNINQGIIKDVQGFEKVEKMDCVEYVAYYHFVGEKVEKTMDVRQRFAQVLFVANSEEELKKAVSSVYETVHVVDEQGNEMLVNTFDLQLI